MNSAQRIFEILDAKPDVTEDPNAKPHTELKGEITLKDVTFGYEENREVLKNISLSVGAGEMLGIVGKSGAGKTTLVNLITRLYDVKGGEILIDGVNVRDMRFCDLRKNIALVSQETYIFKGTIFDNIAYANPSADRKDVIDAAIAASAHDYICKLPDGYDTDSEYQIQEAFERLRQGRTTFAIAHRLSTLRNADRIAVIDGHKIVELGTHNELLKLKGIYFGLVMAQLEMNKNRE